MNEITINGEATPVEHVKLAIGIPKTNAEVHLQACGDLSEAPDETTRAHQAAMVLTGGAVSSIAQLCQAHLDAGLGESVSIGIDLLLAVFKQHDAHWEAFEACRDGNPPALPADLDERKAVLPGTLSGLKSLLVTMTASVDALADDDLRKPAAQAVLAIAANIIEGAANSADLVEGKVTLLISDEQLRATIEQNKQQIVEMLGKSEAEAQAMLDKQLGATDDEKKASLQALAAAQMAPESEGTHQGAVLSTEQEVALGAEALNRLGKYLQS